MSLPAVTLVATVCSDGLELRFTPAGKAVARARVVCSDRRKDAGGNWGDGPACFLDVTLFGAKAEAAAGEVSKGSLVMVTGRLEMREWTAEDGSKRTSYGVLADEVALVIKAQSANRSQGGEADPWATSPPAGFIPDNADPPF